MKQLIVVLIVVFAWACSNNASNEETGGYSSSLQTDASSSSRSLLHSSSSMTTKPYRVWLLEYPLQKRRVSFVMDESLWDTVWLECKFKNDQTNSILTYSGFLSSLGEGDFDLPDSTFLRGDTIQYRLAYTLDGKLDSTAWQEYVFLGNHTQLIFGKDTTLIQQFDSIQYPIVLGPQDSCGRALMSSILTYSTVDTFDYESNWDAFFSDGREYISNYDPFCHGDPQFKMAFFTLISYKGDINDAAKAIQKVNPRFFITLTPWCEELTACETVQTQ